MSFHRPQHQQRNNHITKAELANSFLCSDLQSPGVIGPAEVLGALQQRAFAVKQAAWAARELVGLPVSASNTVLVGMHCCIEKLLVIESERSVWGLVTGYTFLQIYLQCAHYMQVFGAYPC